MVVYGPDKTMNILGMDFSDFSGQYLKAALIVSLMSVWMLVGLFYYLNQPVDPGSD